MSFRLPQSLESMPTSEQALNVFNAEVLAEKAASLGRAGKLLAERIAALGACVDAAARETLVQDIADAAHHLMIQRELCGLHGHRAVIEEYRLPGEVVARIGAR